MDDSDSVLATKVEALGRCIDKLCATRPVQGNPYNNSYDPCWGSHLDFSSYHYGQQWEHPQPIFQEYTPLQEQWHNYPPDFQYEPTNKRKFSAEEVFARFMHQTETKPHTTDEVLARFMQTTDAKFEAIEAIMTSVQTSLHNLADNMGKLIEANSKEQQSFEQEREVPFGNDKEVGESNNEVGKEEHVVMEKNEEVKEAIPITIEQATYLEADHPTKSK